MAGEGSVGSIYAEATLDVSAFIASAGSLEAASAQIAAALGQAALGAEAAQAAVGGMASGIASGGSAVIAAVASVARAAAAAARSALQIHSPSRVTMALGEAFDQGFVKGVAARSPEVVRAVERVVAVTPSGVAAARRETPAPTAPGRGVDYERLAAAAASRPTVLMLDGRILAEAGAGQTARAQNARTRRIAVRYGTR